MPKKNIAPKNLSAAGNSFEENKDYFLELDNLKNNSGAASASPADDWLTDDYEGQLAIDVYQTPNDIVIKAAIAGVKPEDINISLSNDLLTIRGKRQGEKEVREEDYFYRECYWGGFSRSIILPLEVNTDAIDASFRNGILIITLPKIKKGKAVDIPIKGEE
jgi:HSP20 family protein